MTKKSTFSGKLNTKTVLLCLLGLVLSLSLYFIILSAGEAFIRNRYMSEQAVNQRKSEIYNEFTAYVSANAISGRNSAAVARWTREHEHVTIYIFETGRARQGYSEGKTLMGDMPRDYDSAVYGKLYPVRFSDGIYHIAISDDSQHHQSMLVKIAAISCACAVFLLMQFMYTRRLTRRIIALSREAASVSSWEMT